MPKLLFWKGGIVTEDPTDTIAKTVDAIYAARAPYVYSSMDIARLRDELAALEERAKDNERRAESLALDVTEAATAVGESQSRLNWLKKQPPCSERAVEIQELEGVVMNNTTRPYELEGLIAKQIETLNKVRRRYETAKNIAKATRKLIAEWPYHDVLKKFEVKRGVPRIAGTSGRSGKGNGDPLGHDLVKTEAKIQDRERAERQQSLI